MRRKSAKHLEIGSILSILKDHAEPSPQQLLFLWNLFEGVLKFYRDGYEQNVLAADRRTILRRIFFQSSSPLRSEAEHGFLRELRGRYDVVLKFVARNPGRMHNALVQAIREASGNPDTQVGGYLKVLIERFGLIERELPVFARPEAKRSRFYVTDNFLRSWLAALANPVSATAFRPLQELVDEADQRLEDVEGASLEKWRASFMRNKVAMGWATFQLPIEFRVFGTRRMLKSTLWLSMKRLKRFALVPASVHRASL